MNVIRFTRTVSFSFLLALLFLQTGCTILSEEELIEEPQSRSAVLALPDIQVLGAGMINTDSCNFDDRIHDLGMLVFDSSSGVKVGQLFIEGVAFDNRNLRLAVKVTPGIRDFYFVANRPLDVLKGIENKAQMKLYMDELQYLDAPLFLTATADKGFPMSRIYENEVVMPGGSADSPIQFYPKGAEKVQLVRSVAKLEVRIIDGLKVQNVYYRNAFRKFSLNSLPPSLSPEYYPDTPLVKIDSNTYVFYVPEVIQPPGTTWGTGEHKPINYFVVKTEFGIEYEIPIITENNPAHLMNYLSFAKGELSESPDYSVYRNSCYRYYLSLSHSIEVYSQILPWILENKGLFMGYWFNLETSSADVLITNTAKAFPPHRVRLETIPPFTFEDGSTEKVFEDYSEDAFALYKMNLMPTGEYMNVYYNDMLVKTIRK